MDQLSDEELDHTEGGGEEEDSDKEDQDLDKMFGAWLGELDKLTQNLDDGFTETVKKAPQKAPLRQETNMANFCNRFSMYNINEALNQGGDNVDLDSLMADLCSIEQELTTIGKPNAKLRQKPTAGRSSSAKGHGGAGGSGGGTSSSGDSTSSSTRASPASTVAARHGRPMASNLSLDDITAQLEQASLSMDEAARQSSHSLASGSTSSSSSSTMRRPASHHHTHRRTGSVGTVSEHEALSFSLSSRSSVNSASASSMDSLDRPSEQDGVTPTQQGPNQGPPGNTEHSYLDRETSLILKNIAGKPSHLLTKEEQAAKTKAEKIRVALEKIKEAQVKKLVIRVHLSDESSKTMMVDERQTVRQVLDSLLDKSHCGFSPDWSLVETINELQMERIFEDHENLVENLLNWTRDSQNRLMFIERLEKYALFKNPQNYLLGRKETCEMADRNKEALLEECFCGSSVSVPEMEGVLWLKEDGKKSWKKRYFLLRASGIYYVPKGKAKASRELVCFLQLDHVNVYNGQDYRSKYKAPTDYCLALKHPQIQKKSQYIKYLCCNDVRTLHQWINGIRIAKYGKTLYVNYQEAMKRTEAAYDWSSLSSSSIKSGSSSSSLPESQSTHCSSDSGVAVSENNLSGHSRSQSQVSSIFSEAWKRGTQDELRMESVSRPYPLMLPSMHQSAPASRTSYTSVSPESSHSPPDPPPPSPPPLPHPPHQAAPTNFVKYSTIARLQGGANQAANHYNVQPMGQQEGPPAPPLQSVKPNYNTLPLAPTNYNTMPLAPSNYNPPPPPPPCSMPAPGSAMASLRFSLPSSVPQFIPPPPPPAQTPPPPPPPEEDHQCPPLSNTGLQQFLAQKFPNMNYDFSELDGQPESPPPPPALSPLSPILPPPTPPKTFSGVFPPQTAPKTFGSGIPLSPVSPYPPSGPMKKQQSFSTGHSPNQPPSTMPKQHIFSSKTLPLSAPISPTPSLAKQIVNQFPGAPLAPQSPPAVKAKPRWQPGGQIPPQSPEFPLPPPLSPSKMGSPIKKSPSTSSTSSSGSFGKRGPPPTPQRASSIKSNSSGDYQEEGQRQPKKVESLVSKFAQPGLGSCNSSTATSSGSPAKDVGSPALPAPPKPGKLNLSALPLVLQGLQTGQHRQPSEDFPSLPQYRQPSGDFPSLPQYRQPSEDFPSPPQYRQPSEDFPSPPQYRQPSEDFPSPPQYRQPSEDFLSLPQYRQPSGDFPSLPQYRLPSEDFPSLPQYRLPSEDFPSLPQYRQPSEDFPPPPPDSELLPPPPLLSELHPGAPRVAVVNPQPQATPISHPVSQSSWKTQSLKKTPPLTLHRLSRSHTVQEPLPLSPPYQHQTPPASFACPRLPTSPGVPKGGGTLSSVQPNFLEDLNRTLKRKSISRHGSLTRHGSTRLEPVSMDDMALPPPPPPDQQRGGQGGGHGYMSSGYATLRRGPRPAPPKRDESTKLTGEW
ncbi:ras-associated and pleckstrin homology domains-containing protein 1a isoform X1 [Salvelinus fontinalis]|uniref:ras-associated and pleckstrin homology domains-containing protein 1a isoform X1 n=2 Tax=Salvelinus fontinalis TaxID=8038 RepID=UPI002486C31C|nr:ras-associated and pleckstrin homology domains-containing protein 1a isoform X1 [Salvelinus fontinalis]